MAGGLLGNNRVVAEAKMLVILQGRLKSTRLPCKGFFNFFGQTIWERMCDIAREIDFAEKVVFATGDIPENYLAKPLVEAKGVEYFAGSEEDVLARFCDVIRLYPTEYIIRITCDNYLVQPELIEDLYRLVRNHDADYGYISPLSHYCGEIVRSELLIDNLYGGSASQMTREHVTWDVRNSYKTKIVSLPGTYKRLNHVDSLTLDNVNDFVIMKYLEQTRPDLEPVRCLQALKTLREMDRSCILRSLSDL